MQIGKDVHPTAQSGTRRIAKFGFCGETGGAALASVKGYCLRGKTFETIKAKEAHTC
jgi:hypothetical protein